MAKKLSATDEARSKCQHPRRATSEKPKGARNKASQEGRDNPQAGLARRDGCRVRHTPNYLSKGWSHIEIIVRDAEGCAAAHHADRIPLALPRRGLACEVRWTRSLLPRLDRTRSQIEGVGEVPSSSGSRATCSLDPLERRLHRRAPQVPRLTATRARSHDLATHVLAMYSLRLRTQKSSAEAKLQASDFIEKIGCGGWI